MIRNMLRRLTMRRLLLVLCGVALAWIAPAGAQPFSPEQKTAIEKLIREYLVNNPEILLEAIEKLQEKEAADEPSAKQLSDSKTTVFRDPETPVANAAGTIPVVEFFDYKCGYCKRMVPDIQRLREEAKDVRLVFKDLPILGPDSVVAARAALASRAQGKYEAYHFALMAARGSYTEDKVLAIAKDVGLDVERLKRDMKDPRIDAKLEENLKLAKKLNIRGTPAMIIGDAFVMGSADFAGMMKLVEKARTSCKVC
jgi:protein-disulfide isomerase